MKLPTREECQAILEEYNVPPNIVAHAQLVAQVAVYLAKALNAAGQQVDVELVERAALLHDLDKLLTLDERARHGALGAEILQARGYPELARIVLRHPLPALVPEFEAWPWEDRLVHYADKIAVYRVLSLRERLARMRERHPEYEASFCRLEPLEQELERTILAAMGRQTLELPADWNTGD